MEIGSIYELNPEALAEAGKGGRLEPGLEETAKYGKKYGKYTASGREAIALALKSFAQNRTGASKICLLPAYMCDSVFFPFERDGWEIHFYHIKENLEAEEEKLCRQIEEVRPDLLFIHPYYGVDTWKPMRSFLLEWRRQGICIMEDVTQSYYLETAGKEADYVVGSLRKWYAVPDGGFVVSDHPLPEEELPVKEAFTARRLEALTEKWRYLHGGGTEQEKQQLKADYLKKNRELEELLDHDDGIGAISPETASLLCGIEERECKRRRNDNYRYLFKNIKENTEFRPALSAEETAGTAPLYFPIYVREREKLQKFLAAQDIFAPVLWPVGKENEDCLTETEQEIYRHLLALPVDQRYGEEEMQRIVEALETYKEEETVHGAEIIGIRADANDTVASGHMMRCITIAKELMKRGEKVMFFTADEYPRELLEQAGMEYVCLHTQWNRMEEETKQLAEKLKVYGCGRLLVDSYQVTKEYLKQLRAVCRIIYMDDCFEEIWPVDLLINYNAYHVRFPYEEAYRNTDAKLLLGTAYVPLREEFSESTAKRRPARIAKHRLARTENDTADSMENVSAGGTANATDGGAAIHVLLSSGGGDRYHALSGILSELFSGSFPAAEQMVFHVVAGSFHPNRKELETLAEGHPDHIKLHYDVTNMAELMAICDSAVSAAGTMLFELCAMQVPTVFFISADNQKYDSEFFAQEERMLFAGDLRSDREACLKKICAQILVLAQDKNLRERMKTKLCEVTDGRGAQRIAEAVIDL